MATSAAVPPTSLADENLRGFVMLLSAHFQGFCRDLYTECVQIVAASAPAGMQPLIQRQCLAGRQLDQGNPSYKTLREDFDRFGFSVAAALAVNPANAPRITHIDHLNSARNFAAHHKASMPVGGPLVLPDIRAWKNSCDGLAAELDGIMYNQLQATIGAPPW